MIKSIMLTADGSEGCVLLGLSRRNLEGLLEENAPILVDVRKLLEQGGEKAGLAITSVALVGGEDEQAILNMLRTELGDRVQGFEEAVEKGKRFSTTPNEEEG